jgi:hypothetical protein
MSRLTPQGIWPLLGLSEQQAVLQKMTAKYIFFLFYNRTMLVNVEVSRKPSASQADSGGTIELQLSHHLQLASFEQSLELP